MEHDRHGVVDMTDDGTGARPSGVRRNWPARRAVRMRTARFTLRDVRPDDISDRVVSWFHQPAFKRAFPTFRGPQSREELGKRLRLGRSSRVRHFFIWAQDRPIGLFIVEFLDAPGEVVQTHNFIGERAWWGHGVVHEARAGLIEALFRSGALRVIGLPRADNRAAVQTYRDQGFVEEGVLRDHYPHPDGGRADVVFFAVLRREWDYARARRLPPAVAKRRRRRQDAGGQTP